MSKSAFRNSPPRFPLAIWNMADRRRPSGQRTSTSYRPVGSLTKAIPCLLQPYDLPLMRHVGRFRHEVHLEAAGLGDLDRRDHGRS